jgi:high-affinity nickel-transport protein
MSGLPADALGLAALVFLLGLRHGLDPDHLVAIDGLTRASRREGTRRWCGLFFSLGHGVVITLVGLAVAIAATEWQAPPWLRTLGTFISVLVLLVLGLANLAMAWRTPAERPVPLVGLRGRWLTAQASRGSHPAFVAAIGAAFALSFDTISHALAFSVTGAALAGGLFATLLGLVFTLGMVITDAANGLWVAKMVAAADRRALRASRAMSVAIAMLCLAVAASAAVELELAQPVLAIASVLAVAMAYLLASRSAARSTYGDAHSPYGTAKKR